MLETHNDALQFKFPKVHEQANVTVDLQRTLRIPDDGQTHALPPGLGRFPIRHIDGYKDRVPADWIERGGLMVPLYQSEALWIKFTGGFVSGRQGTHHYPMAIKIAAGKRSAVTGRKWKKKGLRKKDYVIVPRQPWIDGFVTEKGIIRQFVAMPLGMGVTVEEQLTDEAEFGGIQIEVFPMKREVFERRFPVRPKPPMARRSRARRLRNDVRLSAVPQAALNYTRCIDDDDLDGAVAADMGLGAGGQMRQEIFDDPYDKDDWDTKRGSRVFIHLANSIAWKAITTEHPPHQPPTAAVYTAHGLPWFDYYADEGFKTLKGSKQLKAIKSVLELGFQKGLSGLIENQPTGPKNVVGIKAPKEPKKPKKRKGKVRDGAWT